MTGARLAGYLPRLRRLLRTLAIIAVVIAVPALLTLGAVVLVLRSETAIQWALQTAHRLLPELTVVAPQGNLIDGLHVDSLRWEDPDLELIIAPIDLRLSWANLLRGRATVDPLRIGRITIHPRGPDNDDPIVLPALVSPIALHVPRLELGELVIRSGDTVTTLRDIKTAVRWLGPDISLTNPRLAYETFALDASAGKLQFLGAYPLTLQGVITSADLPGPATVAASGDLRALRLDAQLAGAWPLKAQAVLRTLDTNLPFAVSAQLVQPLPLDAGVDVVTVQQAALKAAGDLDRFTGTLQSQLTDTRYGNSHLDGTFSWENNTLAATAALILPSGKIDSRCQLETTTERWQCQGDIAALPLTPWLNGLSGEMSTPYTVAGRLSDPIELRIELPDIRGKLEEIALTGAARAESPDLKRWSIPEFHLNAGPNHLSASGTLSDNSRLHVQVEAPRLQQLYAGLAGSARGAVDITGALATPTLHGELALRDVVYQAGTDPIKLHSGRVRFTVADLGRTTSDIDVVLSGLEVSGQRAAVDASWRGTRADHRWQVALSEQRDTIELDCRGALTDNDRRYRLDCPTVRGNLALPSAKKVDKKTVSWGLQAPLQARWDFERSEGGIDAFCLAADPATLCVKPGVNYRQGQVQAFSATLTQLPLRWWRRGLAEGLRLSNDPHLNADLHFAKQQPLQLRAQATLDASEWRWRNGEQARTLKLDSVTASADLDTKRAHLTAALRAPELGSATAELTVLDPLQAKQLQGRVDLNALQLAAFGWAIPDVEAITGQVDGAVTIAGTAALPILAGEFALINGSVDVAGVSDPITDLGARLRFDNQRADLDGQFQLGTGRAQLKGDMLWSEGYADWRATLHARGSQLQIEPITGSTVVFAPDLTLDATPDQLRLHGEVMLEKADIRLQELPPETVNPSRDTVVIGREATATGIPLTLDIALNLGEQTHFSGFGAEVDLAGQLRLLQEDNRDLAATGRINVTRGRYRAYGQRLIVRKGQFIFVGNLDNPDINLEAIREMIPGNTDVVGLRISGSLHDPVAQLFSEQSLSESDMAYYLLTGTKRDSSESGSQFSAGGSLLSLGLAKGEDQAAKLAEKFGIRGLTLGTAAASDGTTQAEVSGYLFRKLYVRYGRSLGQNADSVTLQYQLSPNLMIQSISGIEEVLELIYTFTID
ncbi:MAG: translocation/assembly module TamB domain-containing protein [Spongiibacteraceae bacterium]